MRLFFPGFLVNDDMSVTLLYFTQFSFLFPGLTNRHPLHLPSLDTGREERKASDKAKSRLWKSERRTRAEAQRAMFICDS